jgi:hypothetical protein
MNIFKIQNIKTKEFYLKTTSSAIQKCKDGKYYKIPTFNTNGKTFNSEKELNAALKQLTQMKKSTKLRSYNVYPIFKEEDLEVISFE